MLVKERGRASHFFSSRADLIYDQTMIRISPEFPHD